MHRYTGIVLKKDFSKSFQIFLLDSQLGKIAAIPNTENICTGSIIEYQKAPRQRKAIYGIDTIMIPTALAQEDILFLHHLLELLFYFLSVEVPAPDIFDLMYFLYTYEKKPLSTLFKKIFVVKLLVACGVYPENKKFHSLYFSHLVSESVDNLIDRGLDLGFEECLDEWLLSCISTHPNIEQFKTVHFLSERRAV